MLREPNPKCEGFDRLIDDVISVFNKYCAKAGDEDELSEFEMKNIIQRIFEEMKDGYPLDKE